jgi:hypothetical protein
MTRRSRSEAARKGWRTRRARAAARSRAARKGWRTRRARAQTRKRAAKKASRTRRRIKTRPTKIRTVGVTGVTEGEDELLDEADTGEPDYGFDFGGDEEEMTSG